MQTLDAIKTRRSIRKYKAEQITDEQLDAILEAGTYAATGMGKQSPVIVVVQKPELIAKLSKMNAAVMGTTSDPFYGAPTVLIVLADPERGTYVEDGSLVMGNLMLAAHALDIGSCWIHRARQEFESAEGKALMKAAESRAAQKAEEIQRNAEKEADTLRKTAEQRLEEAAEFIVGRVVSH